MNTENAEILAQLKILFLIQALFMIFTFALLLAKGTKIQLRYAPIRLLNDKKIQRLYWILVAIDLLGFFFVSTLIYLKQNTLLSIIGN